MEEFDDNKTKGCENEIDRRNFFKHVLKYLMGLSVFGMASLLGFSRGNDINLGVVKKNISIDGAEAYGMCSYGSDCGGGGGTCSYGSSCSGGGGTCSYGSSCSGGGGTCSYGSSCSGS